MVAEADEKTIARVLVENKLGEPVGRLTFFSDTAGTHIRMAPAGDSAERSASFISNAKETLQQLPSRSQTADPKTRWDLFLAQIEKQGFSWREIPPHDFTVEMVFDMRRGKTFGATTPAYPGAADKDGVTDAVARRIEDTLIEFSVRHRGTLIDDLKAFISQGRYAEAATYAAEHIGDIRMLGTADLVRLLLQIDRTKLDGATKRKLFETILAAADTVKDFATVIECAEEALPLFCDKADAPFRHQLVLMRANGLSQKGGRETARVLYRALLDDPAADSGTRAWALRGLSLTVDPLDADGLVFDERAGDAFVEAGNHREAAISYVHVAKRLIVEDPTRAMALFDRALPWITSDNPPNRNARAGLQQMRADLLSSMGRFEDAIVAVEDAIALRTGVFGAEAMLVSSLNCAALICKQHNDLSGQMTFQRQADEIVSRLPPPEALRFRLASMMSAGDLAGMRRIRAERPPGFDHEMETLVDVFDAVSHDGERSYAERIAQLEAALTRIGDRDLGLQEQVAAALAEVHRQHNSLLDAARWYRRVLDLDPAHPVARQNLVIILMQEQQYAEVISLLKRDVELFGDRPGVLLWLGRALLKLGDAGEAAKVLSRARRLSSTTTEQRKRIEEDLDRALRDPKYVALPDEPTTVPIGLPEIEAVLQGFSDHISRDRRREFWERTTKGYKYVSRPEALAKSVLWSWLKSHFKARVEILEEVPAGAGRLDLYLRFEGGLRLVVELKICGTGYSASYAEQGLNQLLHYLESKETRLGYLVVFDSRRRDNAKPFEAEANTGDKTLYVHFVDIRPDVPISR